MPQHILSFIENYEHHDNWQLPFELNNTEELNVYETISSSQGIVRLKPMIKHEININDVFRLSYAVLWREVLDEELKTNLDIIREWLEEYNYDYSGKLLDNLTDKITILEEIERLGREGVYICERIIENLLGVKFRRLNWQNLVKNLSKELPSIILKAQLLQAEFQRHFLLGDGVLVLP